jgi:Zn-dependent peptidase ImmA (M78 family)
LSKDFNSLQVDANRFAMALLMPEKMVVKELSKQKKKNKDLQQIVEELSEIFQVETSIMAIRLKELKLIAL